MRVTYDALMGQIIVVARWLQALEERLDGYERQYEFDIHFLADRMDKAETLLAEMLVSHPR